MVAGAATVEAPGGGGELAFGEGLLLAPPDGPEAAGIGPGGEAWGGVVVGEEAGGAEEEGIGGVGAGAGAVAEFVEGNAAGEFLGGVGVVFVTEGAEDGLVESLFGADGLNGAGHAEGFAAEALLAGGVEEGGAAGIVEGFAVEAEGVEGAVDVPGVGGGVDAVEKEMGAFFEGVAEGDFLAGGGEEAGGEGAGFVGDVEADVAVAGVLVVAVVAPVEGADMDFDIAGDAAAGDGPFRVEKIGAGFKIPAAGFEDPDRFAAGGGEGDGAEAVVIPDAVQVAFGEGVVQGRFGFADTGARVRGQLPVGAGEGEAVQGVKAVERGVRRNVHASLHRRVLDSSTFFFGLVHFFFGFRIWVVKVGECKALMWLRMFRFLRLKFAGDCGSIWRRARWGCAGWR